MAGSPLAIIRRLPVPVQLLIAGTLVNKAGAFIVPYLAIVLRRDFHLDAGRIGTLMMAYGFGSIVSILAGGAVTDRLGRRVALLSSLLGSGLLAIALGLSPSIEAFVPLLIVFGFLADLYRPAASAIIGDLLPSSQRIVGFAALRMAVNLGFSLGMGLGGLVAQWSWRLLFVVDGLTTFAYGVIVFLKIPETRPAVVAPGRAADSAASSSPWRDPVFLQVILVGLCCSLVFFSFVTALPLTMTVSAGYPTWVFGLIVGMNGLLIAVFEVSVVDWLAGVRRLRLAALGMALCGVGFALTGLVMHWAWFVFTVVVWTAGEILSMPQQAAFVADWAPPASRGRYLSLHQATWSVAFALNPILFLPLYARLPEAAFWMVMLPITLPAAVVLWRLDRVDRPERLRGLSRDGSPEGRARDRGLDQALPPVENE